MDDTQLYISFKCKDPLESLTKLSMRISDIRVWMNKIYNFEPELSDLSISVGDTQVSPSSKVRDLGVVFDQYLTFHNHISGICKSTHFHLRSIGLLMPLHNLFRMLLHTKIPEKEVDTHGDLKGSHETGSGVYLFHMVASCILDQHQQTASHAECSIENYHMMHIRHKHTTYA